MEDIRIDVVRQEKDFPAPMRPRELAQFLHEYLKPFEDSLEDIQQGITDAITPGRQQGFIILGFLADKLVGAVVMLSTGMKGYVPENFLLFVAVERTHRGQGIGGKLITRAIGLCKGGIKVHVEHDNPAKRLYERLGFGSKYLEMRHLAKKASTS